METNHDVAQHHARSLLRKTTWNLYESIEKYKDKLDEAARMCAFGAELDRELATAIVTNCNDKELKERLNWQTDQTTAAIIRTCRTHEIIKKAEETSMPRTVNLINQNVQQAPINVQKQYNKPNEIDKVNSYYKKTNEAKISKIDCYNCGEQYPHKNDTKCKALGHQCRRCDKYNHFESCCWSIESNRPSWLKEKTRQSTQKQQKRHKKTSTRKK